MNNLIRGTTPTLVYTCTSEDMDLESLVEIWFIIKQRSSGPEITYTLSSNGLVVDTEHRTISIKMSQTDTLQFRPDEVEIQLRALDNKGLAYATDIFTVNIGKILKGGVIGD